MEFYYKLLFLFVVILGYEQILSAFLSRKLTHLTAGVFLVLYVPDASRNIVVGSALFTLLIIARDYLKHGKLDRGIVCFGVVVNLSLWLQVPFMNLVPLFVGDPLAAIIGKTSNREFEKCLPNFPQTQFNERQEPSEAQVFQAQVRRKTVPRPANDSRDDKVLRPDDETHSCKEISTNVRRHKKRSHVMKTNSKTVLGSMSFFVASFVVIMLCKLKMYFDASQSEIGLDGISSETRQIFERVDRTSFVLARMTTQALSHAFLTTVLERLSTYSDNLALGAFGLITGFYKKTAFASLGPAEALVVFSLSIFTGVLPSFIPCLNRPSKRQVKNIPEVEAQVDMKVGADAESRRAESQDDNNEIDDLAKDDDMVSDLSRILSMWIINVL